MSINPMTFDIILNGFPEVTDRDCLLPVENCCVVANIIFKIVLFRRALQSSPLQRWWSCKR